MSFVWSKLKRKSQQMKVSPYRLSKIVDLGKEKNTQKQIRRPFIRKFRISKCVLRTLIVLWILRSNRSFCWFSFRFIKNLQKSQPTFGNFFIPTLFRLLYSMFSSKLAEIMKFEKKIKSVRWKRWTTFEFVCFLIKIFQI